MVDYISASHGKERATGKMNDISNLSNDTGESGSVTTMPIMGLLVGCVWVACGFDFTPPTSES